jgi:hypothetical protein
LSEFWRQIFTRIGVALLYSTAYHPQTDGSSERTNQTVEIALRYYLASLDDYRDWPDALPHIQAQLNNLKGSTDKTPNEICYGFTPNFALDITKVAPELAFSKIDVRQDVQDAIDLININSKKQYDRHHTPMFLKVGDYALLRFHKGYKIPSAANKKLSQQYSPPLKVIERIGRLAYRLEIPTHWKIHNVFSIQPTAAPEADPYKRPVLKQPEAVDAEQDLWEVEALLDKRVIRKGRGYATEYLVKWKGYGVEWDQWINVKNLDCDKLVKEYKENMVGFTCVY